MATTDNYIDIFISADAKELKNGLADAERSIKEADSSFKANTANMENWQKSTDGIREKVKQLTNVLEVQRKKEAILSVERDRATEKMNKLQQEYDEAVASGNKEKKVLEQLSYRLEQQKKATSDLTVKYNKQVATTKVTEKELKNYSDTLQQAEEGTIDLEQVTLRAGKAVDKLGDESKDSGSKLDSIKGVAKGIGAGIAAVGTAAIGGVSAFLALGESTRETRNNMAKIETGFKTAGLTAEQATGTYSKLYGVLGDTGKATEATAMIGQMAKSEEDLANWTDIATGVYATFGDSLPIENLAEASLETSKTGKITGGLADALNWAGVSEEEFQKQLDACTTEQERQKLITDTLTNSYSAASDQFKETNKDIIAAQEADAALSLAMAELGAIAEPIMTNLKVLATELVGAMQPFVELLGGGLTDAMNGVSGGAEKMAEGISGIIMQLVDTVSSMLPTLIDLVMELIPQLLTALLDATPQILDTVISGVLSIINGLAEMIPVIVDKIMEILPILITKLIDAIPDLISAAITLLMALVEAIPVIISELIKSLPTIIDSIISALLEAQPMLIDAAIELLMALIDAIPIIIDALLVALPDIIDAVITGLLDAIPLILEASIKLWMALIDAIPTIILELIAELPRIWTTIFNALKQAGTTLFTKAKEFFKKLPEAIPTIISKVQEEIQNLIDKMIEKFKNIGDSFKKFGKEVVEGLWNGIKDKTKWIKDKISGFVGDVKKFFTDFFGIKSPSKLMHDTVGMFIGEGIGTGIVDSLPFVKKDIDAFSNKVANDLGKIKGGLTLNTNTGGTNNTPVATGGVVNNFTQIINTPKQPRLEEMYRYTGNLLDLKGGVV